MVGTRELCASLPRVQPSSTYPAASLHPHALTVAMINRTLLESALMSSVTGSQPPRKPHKRRKTVIESGGPNAGTLCPLCRRTDRVEKLSVVVSSGEQAIQLAGSGAGASYGLATGLSVGGGNLNLKGQASSQLASKLAPPPEPSGVTSVGCGSIGGVGCVTTILAAAASLAAFWISLTATVMAAGIYTLWALDNQREARPGWQARLRRWEESYFCLLGLRAGER